MTPFSRLQLDTEHLNQPRTRSLPEASQRSESVERGLGDAETSKLLRADSTQFADVCLADPPRSLSGITRTSAGNTPRKPTPPPPQLPNRTPSPGPKPGPGFGPGSRPPLPAGNSHRRQASGASAGGGSDAMGRAEVAAETSAPELPERLSWGSDDLRQAGLASTSFAPLKESRSYAESNGKAPSLSGLASEEDAPVLPEKAAERTCSPSGCFAKDPLLALTVIGVLLGLASGLALRPAHLTPAAIEVLGFPGEIMLRLLKMLVLPLVAGSMVAGVCALRGSAANMSRVARCTLAYYAFTTITAVLLGIVLVNDVAAEDAALDEPVSPLSALLGVARSVFPENAAAAAVDMNILGIITFSLFFGLALASMGEAADPFVRGIEVFNQCISKMVSAVLWTSPLGVASLISASVAGACDLAHTLAALGLWVGAVLAGLALFACLVLPALLWGAARAGPAGFLRDFSPAAVLAFGTSSSSAALPVAMECAAKAGCDDSITRFVLPLGTTVNMNGTALYEATTVIFIAQAHGVHLGLSGTFVVACTATLAAIGAAAIPSAGLVTMLMVLQAVSLERFAADLAMILAVDWLLDRCRTAVNLLSDCLAVVIVDRLARDRRPPAYSQIEMA